MNAFTKTMVVFVTILAIVLVALVVPFVAKTENFQQLVQEARTQKNEAESRAKTLQSEITAMQNKESERVAMLTAKEAELAAKLTDLQTELAVARADREEEGRKIADLEAVQQRLSAAANQAVAMLEAQTAELNANRDKVVELQTKLIQQVDRNTELEGTVAGYDRQLRQIKELMQTIQEENKRLSDAFAKLDPETRRRVLQTSPDSTTVVKPTFDIVGKVTRVSRANGQTLIEIDVGRTDGVQQNMEFMVHREGKFLGNAVVTQVDTADAAAHMQLLQGDVQEGDSVYAGPSS